MVYSSQSGTRNAMEHQRQRNARSPIIEPRWAPEAYRRGTQVFIRHGIPMQHQLQLLKRICGEKLERLRGRLERGLRNYRRRFPFHCEEAVAIARRLNGLNRKIIETEIRLYAVLDALLDVRRGVQPVRHVVMIGEP